MADQQKVYLRCSAKARTFSNGGSVINVGVKADELIEFARKHANQGGYVNLVIQERKRPGQYGDTHSVSLDTYTPKPRASREPGDDDWR